MFSVPSQPGGNRARRTFGRIREQISENRRRSAEFSQTLPRFSPGTDNMFYFFYKTIFRLNKEKDDIRSAYVYFNFIHETINSHNLEKGPTILLTPPWEDHFSLSYHLWTKVNAPTSKSELLRHLRFYSDEGLTSETSVSILSFLRCNIYIFITKSSPIHTLKML